MKIKPVLPEPPFVDRLTPAQRKRIVKLFEQTGSSTHSARMVTTATVLRHCLDHGIPFRLEVHPKLGAFVQRMPRMLFP